MPIYFSWKKSHQEKQSASWTRIGALYRDFELPVWRLVQGWHLSANVTCRCGPMVSAWPCQSEAGYQRGFESCSSNWWFLPDIPDVHVCFRVDEKLTDPTDWPDWLSGVCSATHKFWVTESVLECMALWEVTTTMRNGNGNFFIFFVFVFSIWHLTLQWEDTVYQNVVYFLLGVSRVFASRKNFDLTHHCSLHLTEIHSRTNIDTLFWCISHLHKYKNSLSSLKAMHRSWILSIW